VSTRILPEFELVVPQSLGEAVEHLREHGGSTAILAGGTDLLVLMKSGLSQEYVLSLAEIPGLDRMRYDSSAGLRIGAMTTLAEVAGSDTVKTRYPALWRSAVKNGTVQTRNAGTVVGNILRASPAGDCCCAALAYGGRLVLEGPQGTREVDLDDFWIKYRVTARREDEIAVELKLPPQPQEARSAFRLMSRTSHDLSKINAAAWLTVRKDVCTAARLVMGAVAPTTVRLTKCEEMLEGKRITEELLRQVADAAPGGISPIDDIRSTAEYRRAVSGVLLERTIRDAMQEPHKAVIGG
jgi:carbon-monoxide dehydrogenase medium subunit